MTEEFYSKVHDLKMKRVNLAKIFADPKVRRDLMARAIQTIQAREGIDTTIAQAKAAYDKIQLERKNR